MSGLWTGRISEVLIFNHDLGENIEKIEGTWHTNGILPINYPRITPTLMPHRLATAD